MIIERDVELGSSRAEGEGTVGSGGYARARKVMDGVVGFKGVAGREWARYQTRTEGFIN